MDRFEWSDGCLGQDESFVDQQTGVALYDGNDKTSFEHGVIVLTTHRLTWRHYRDRSCVFSLPLSLVIYLEEQSSGFAKSAKIAVHLSRPDSGRGPGPTQNSRHDFIRLSFREAGEKDFYRSFSEQLKLKLWERKLPSTSSTGLGQAPRHRAGIVGIERSLQKKQEATDRDISVAFQDLKKLMEKAQEMVSVSKNIATKIREKQGDITEDETVRFKSYLLSMGIPDPVTRETHGTGAKYYTELARQLSSVLEKPIKESGGMMTLTDAYCRVNRARGMELLSPEDLLNACELLEDLRLPLRMRTFESGVLVLQLQSHSEEEVIVSTTKQVEEKGSLTAEELAQTVTISVILAKERLLLTEKTGGVCRDETVEGLRFYPNLFITRTE